MTVGGIVVGSGGALLELSGLAALVYETVASETTLDEIVSRCGPLDAERRDSGPSGVRPAVSGGGCWAAIEAVVDHLVEIGLLRRGER